MVPVAAAAAAAAPEAAAAADAAPDAAAAAEADPPEAADAAELPEAAAESAGHTCWGVVSCVCQRSKVVWTFACTCKMSAKASKQAARVVWWPGKC